MMRKLVLIAFVVAVAFPVYASRRVSVAELQQLLLAPRNAHKSDSALADEISSCSLTEELTPATLDQLTADLHAGPLTAQALRLLADTSAPLPPPAAEIPATPAPDATMQRAIVQGAINFALKTLQHMPDFLASRTTQGFDDAPLTIGHSGLAAFTPLHQVGVFARPITYRDGREVLDAPLAVFGTKPHDAAGPQGLTTSGEFGPVLAIVLGDAVHGKLAWSRWEMTPLGKAAVFHYQVPKEASHYEVDYCCSWDRAYHGKPAYHGDLYIDPFTGAIVRITLEADLENSGLLSYAAVSVQYGKVDIGGNEYVCPLQSVAVSSAFDRQAVSIGQPTPVRRINEVSFTNYHRFGSSTRILADADHIDNVPAPQPPAPAPATPPPAEASAPSQPTPAPAAPSDNAPLVAASNPAPNPPPATAPTADTSHPDVPAASAAVSDATPPMPVFKSATHEVELDAVVIKGTGEPVHGLVKDSFQVKEDGKPQSIDFFEEHVAGAAPAVSPAEMPALPADAQTNVPPAPESDAVNVLLIDMLNSSLQDQTAVNTSIDQFLKGMQPGTRVAIFTLGSKLRFVQGFTADASVLLAALRDKKNGTTRQKDAASRGRTDDSEDAADISRLQTIGAYSLAVDSLRAAQDEVTTMAQNNRFAMTFEALNSLARYLSGVQGRKNLIWFAGSFPITLFPNASQREAMRTTPEERGFLDRVRETEDLLTVAKIAVYPVCAQGVMVEHVMEADVAGPGAAEGSIRDAAHIDRRGPTGNYAAESTDRASIIASMEQLANATGGKAYYNTNDLNGAAQRAINDGSSYYTLAYSPTNQKMDGGFRNIDLRLTDGHYKLSYRHGYNADSKPGAVAPSAGDPLSSLLTLGLPSATGLLYGVVARPATDQPASGEPLAGQNHQLNGPLTRYAVKFILRPADLTMETDAKGERTGKVLIGIKAYDRQGHALNWEGATEEFQLTAREYAALPKSGIPAQMAIDLPANTGFHLVTGIYDWNSGKTGTLEINLLALAAQNNAPSTN